MRHCSWLENGPDERLPSSSIAYQPVLMPRISDLSLLMKWGTAIVVLHVLDHQSNWPHGARTLLRLPAHAPEKFRTPADCARHAGAIGTRDNRCRSTFRGFCLPRGISAANYCKGAEIDCVAAMVRS